MDIFAKIAWTLLVPLAAFMDWLINGVGLSRHNRNYFGCVKHSFCDIWESDEDLD